MPKSNSLPVIAVVPAAGLSRRFGGPNKLLRPWGGGTVVGAVVRTLLEAGLPVIVVTGRDADQVAAACPGARAVFNPQFELGIGTSIAKGVGAVQDECGVLIVLGDMPDLKLETIGKILACYEEPSDIVMPVYGDEPDRPGHPVLFGAAHKNELIGLTGDEGARAVLRAHRQHHRVVRIEGSLPDIDEPDPSR